MATTKDKISKQRGLSLVELVIALTITGFLGLTAASMMRGGFEVASAANQAQDLSYKTRYAVQRISKEIRHTSYNTGGGAYNISVMTANQFRFTNVDGNIITITIGVPTITISYLSPTAGGILTDLVSSASFSYYNGDGTTVALSNSTIRFVEFNLTVSQNGTNYSTRTRIALRDG